MRWLAPRTRPAHRGGDNSPPSAAETARLLRLATAASVSVAVLLLAGKVVAWLLTGSVSVLASLVDSAMDAGASLLNLLAVHWSLRPPDAEHRFGHGKAQPLAALGQSAFIAGSAVFVGLEAVDRLLHPRPVSEAGIGLAILVFAMVLTLALLALQHHVVRRTESSAIRADALHYATDLATNGATLLALGLAWLGWHGADPWLGLAIGALVLVSALRIAHEAVQLLLDHELPPAQRAEIMDLARGVPGALGVHGLRTRKSGQLLVIQLHLELDDDLPLRESHRVALDAEARIRGRYPHSDIIIHQDPVSLGDERGENLPACLVLPPAAVDTVRNEKGAGILPAREARACAVLRQSPPQRRARAMAEIITAIYASADTLPNVRNDLISTGIPQEKIRVSHEKQQIQVMAPEVSEAEVEEILNRHSPTEIQKR